MDQNKSHMQNIFRVNDHGNATAIATSLKDAITTFQWHNFCKVTSEIGVTFREASAWCKSGLNAACELPSNQ